MDKPISCNAVDPCLRHSVSRSCYMISFSYAPQRLLAKVFAPKAYLDVQIVIDFDHLAEDAYPLVQVREVEGVPQFVYQRLRFMLLGECAFGLLKRPLS